MQNIKQKRHECVETSNGQRIRIGKMKVLHENLQWFLNNEYIPLSLSF